MSVNNCHFIGNLGKDPETRFTASGKEVCNFSIAVTEKRKDSEHTEWINVVVWDKLANICAQYLKKGSKVYISGRMQTRSWDDKDGNKRYSTEIVAYSMQMLDSKSTDGGRSQSGNSSNGNESSGIVQKAQEVFNEPPAHDDGSEIQF